MSTIPLPNDVSFEQLRKQAKDLRRSVLRGDAEALAQVAEHAPDLVAPDAGFPLATAQLVVARRHGFSSWARLKRQVERIDAATRRPDEVEECTDPADEVLRLACLMFGSDDPSRWSRAAALLAEQPELPARSIHVAAACCDVEAVRRHLARDPRLADHQGGPHRWTPLLYLAYARHDAEVSERASLATTTVLLDHGADPNAGFLWHGFPSPFTVLTGVFGEGEAGPEASPRHPHDLALARLLLSRGASPNDGQVLYNRSFRPDDAHLELLFEFGLGRGESSTPTWRALLSDDLESPREMLETQLHIAVVHHMGARVRLLLAHGVDPDTRFDDGDGPIWRQQGGRRAVELAAVVNDREMVEILVGAGAEPLDLDPVDALCAAVLAADGDAVRRLVEATPGVVERSREAWPGLVVRAAVDGGSDAVRLAVATGFDVDMRSRTDTPRHEEWLTALHWAASRGDIGLARVLVELGADPSITDANHESTPLGWARHFGQDEVAAYLEPLTPTAGT